MENASGTGLYRTVSRTSRNFLGEILKYLVIAFASIDKLCLGASRHRLGFVLGRAVFSKEPGR